MDDSSSCDEPDSPSPRPTTSKARNDPTTPPKKKIKTTKVCKALYAQKWRECWVSEPKFAGWLTKSSRSTKIKDSAFVIYVTWILHVENLK